MSDASPYLSYPYVIYLNRPCETVFGGFTGVVGLSHGLNKTGDVTLKRGVVNTADLWNWLAAARGSSASANCVAVVTLRNQAGAPITSWKLSNAKPKHYTGPTLGGKGGDTSMEELVLSSESIELIPPH